MSQGVLGTPVQGGQDYGETVAEYPVLCTFKDATGKVGAFVLTAAGALPVDASGTPITITQPVTINGTVTANQGTPNAGGASAWPVKLASAVSVGNSTAIPLAGNGVFTGTGEDVSGYSTVTVIVTADQSTNGAGVSLQFSPDGGNWDLKQAFAYSNSVNSAQTYIAPVTAQFFRVVYTNGAVGQGSFRLQVIYHPGALPQTYMPGQTLGGPNFQQSLLLLAGLDASQAVRQLIVTPGGDGNAASLNGMLTYSVPELITGFTAQLLTDRERTPGTFKTATASASGSTALWTPAAGRKFRLMRYLIEVSANASLAVAGVLTIDLLDSATTRAQTHSLFLPAAAGATIQGAWNSGWIDLGNGILSAAANNVLNINLSAALATGICRVLAVGTEE